MTVAVCLNCGAMKLGALTPCRECRHRPEDLEDQAKHLMTSDHYFSKDDLTAISVRVQSGQPLQFDPQQVAEFVAVMSDVRPGKGAKSIGVGAVVLVLAAIVGAVYLVIRWSG